MPRKVANNRRPLVHCRWYSSCGYHRTRSRKQRWRIKYFRIRRGQEVVVVCIQCEVRTLIWWCRLARVSKWWRSFCMPCIVCVLPEAQAAFRPAGLWSALGQLVLHILIGITAWETDSWIYLKMNTFTITKVIVATTLWFWFISIFLPFGPTKRFRLSKRPPVHYYYYYTTGIGRLLLHMWETEKFFHLTPIKLCKIYFIILGSSFNIWYKYKCWREGKASYSFVWLQYSGLIHTAN